MAWGCFLATERCGIEQLSVAGIEKNVHPGWFSFLQKGDIIHMVFSRTYLGICFDRH